MTGIYSWNGLWVGSKENLRLHSVLWLEMEKYFSPPGTDDFPVVAMMETLDQRPRRVSVSTRDCPDSKSWPGLITLGNWWSCLWTSDQLHQCARSSDLYSSLVLRSAFRQYGWQSALFSTKSVENSSWWQHKNDLPINRNAATTAAHSAPIATITITFPEPLPLSGHWRFYCISARLLVPL